MYPSTISDGMQQNQETMVVNLIGNKEIIEKIKKKERKP
jgi:hypothetical protein